MFRLGLLIPENGIKAKTKLYNLFYTIMTPFYPLMKLIPSITTSSKLGLAMINCVYFPENDKYLDNRKINNSDKLNKIKFKKDIRVHKISKGYFI